MSMAKPVGAHVPKPPLNSVYPPGCPLHLSAYGDNATVVAGPVWD